MSIQCADFIDFYQILQVHQDAEPEIIKSAYRRLAQMYHPDVNPDAQAHDKMQLIIQAYNTVSDPHLRKDYHRIWIRNHQTGKSWQYKKEVPKKDPRAEAQQALDTYFRCLLHEDWPSAYDMLSRKDSGMFSLDDFCEWKEAVKALYQMGSYVIKPFRSYSQCVVNETEYDSVHAFSVFLTDRDKRSGSVNEETYTKYVVWDSSEWRVCLGYNQLKTTIYKLKYLATQAPDMDPGRIYNDMLLKYDKLTGFLSRKGLTEHIEREVTRARRFKNKFCIAIFSIVPTGSIKDISRADYKRMCISHAALQLQKAAREIDILARVSENRFGMLLIETDYTAACKALSRLSRAVRPGDGLTYHIKGSATAYCGESAEESLLRAEHDAQTRIVTGKDNVKRYYINLDDEQV